MRCACAFAHAQGSCDYTSTSSVLKRLLNPSGARPACSLPPKQSATSTDNPPKVEMVDKETQVNNDILEEVSAFLYKEVSVKCGHPSPMLSSATPPSSVSEHHPRVFRRLTGKRHLADGTCGILLNDRDTWTRSCTRGASSLPHKAGPLSSDACGPAISHSFTLRHKYCFTIK